MRWRVIPLLFVAMLAMTPIGLGQGGAVAKKAGGAMKMATGTFEVKIKPEGLSEVAGGSKMGRMSIDKVFHGALEGVSVGEMLSAMGEVKGSAGYVAMERVTGTLDGRRGSFYLQHTGTMNRGTPTLMVTVVPDSGTGELAGLTGSMKILIEGGKHSYEFAYALK